MASTDTLEENTAFADKNGASFPILADVDKSVSKNYGVLETKGYASRFTFYIDPEGMIERIDRDVKPSTLLKFHRALVDRKNSRLFSSTFLKEGQQAARSKGSIARSHQCRCRTQAAKPKVWLSMHIVHKQHHLLSWPISNTSSSVDINSPCTR